MTARIESFEITLYDKVLALWRQCEGVGLSDADSKQHITSYLARNPGMSFVALADGAVIGVVLAGHDGRRGYLHHLAIHPDWRRQGIGRRLVERGLAALSSAGIRKCHVFVFNTNASGAAFWTSLGWTRRSDIGVISRVMEPPERQDRCKSSRS